jgi:Toprim-like/CHC2 zinc finger
MNIEHAKTLALSDILRKLGFEPQKQKETEEWYNSPFREEKTASFKLETKKNIWYDFGEGKGGDIIDFACTYLEKQNAEFTVSDGLRFLSNMSGNAPKITPVNTHTDIDCDSKLSIVNIKKLKHPALEHYLEKRGIAPVIAAQYLQEVRVKNNETGNTIFALGMKNEDKGYELRNPFFKGCVGPKMITFVRGTIPKPPGLQVFEGLMDFLSVATECPDGKMEMDSIILNSLSCMDKATPFIKGYGYKVVQSWMDNDPAGQRAQQSLDQFLKTEEGLEHCPMNEFYKEHKDVNAWHMYKLGLTG